MWTSWELFKSAQYNGVLTKQGLEQQLIKKNS